MNGLLEILTTKKWMMSPDHIATIRQALEHNLNAHLPFESMDKSWGRIAFKDTDYTHSLVSYKELAVSGDNRAADVAAKGHDSTPFVNIIDICGTVTRGGGACSYGSIDHRDLIMNAADDPDCCGHVIYIDTPGGSAFAMNDYQQAIDYAHSKGQSVLAFVDGLCTSAGFYVAALCDERYFMHPKNVIGSIGVLAAFYTKKNGEKNEYTNETYHEIYDPESFDKNRRFREVVDNENDEMLVKELAADGKAFRELVLQHCPNATEEHIHGRTFNAEDVVGILMDGQSTLGDVIARCFALHEKSNPQTNTSTTMKNYDCIATACGVEQLVVTEEGTHLDLSLCDALEETLANTSAALSEANEQVANLAAAVEQVKVETAQAVEAKVVELTAAHEQVVADLKSEYEQTMEGMSEQHKQDIASLTEANQKVVDELNASLTAQKESYEKHLAELTEEAEGAKAALATAEQTIADRDATIKALTEKPAATPDTAPANNGTGATVTTQDLMPAYDSNLSPTENALRVAEWKQKYGIN